MKNLINKPYKSDYYDFLDDKPLLSKDKVKITFPNGSIMETEIHLDGKCVFSSPGFGDKYEFSACIYVMVFGLKQEIVLKDHAEIDIERI